MRKIILLSVFFSLIFAGAAHAAPAINATGAASLQKQVDDELQWNVDMSSILGQGLTADGKATVTPKKDFYEVILPHLYMTLGENEKKTKIDVGQITLNIVPGREDGTWEIQQIKLPPSLDVYDAQNTQEATITIGDQHFTATWAPGLGLYPKSDAVFENIAFTSTSNNVPTVNITAFKWLSSFKNNSDGTWSGAVDFGAEGVTTNTPGSANTISLGKLTLHNVFDHQDMRPVLKIKAEVLEALKHGLPQTDKGKQVLSAKLDTLKSVDAQGIGSEFNASGFSMDNSQGTISFDQLTLAKLSPDMKREKNQLLVKVAFKGLNISSVTEPMAALVPHALNAEITIDNLPEEQLSDTAFALISQLRAAKANPDPAAHQQAMIQVQKDIIQIPKIFGNAGTTISVHNTTAANDDLSATVQGQLKASPENVFGFSGNITLAIKGLDEFLQNQNGLASMSDDPHTQSALKSITALQQKGTPGKAAAGISTRIYALDLKKDGKISLNGAALNGKKTPASGTP